MNYKTYLIKAKELDDTIQESLTNKGYNVRVISQYNGYKAIHEVFIHDLDKKVFLKFEIDLDKIELAIRLHSKFVDKFLIFIKEEK